MKNTEEFKRLHAWTTQVGNRDATLTPILKSLEPLYKELVRMHAALLAAGLRPTGDGDGRMARGMPLYVDTPMGDYAQAFLAASRKIVPAMAQAFPGLSEELRKAMYALESDALDPAPLMEDNIVGNEPGIEAQALRAGIAPATASLVATLVMRPVLLAAGRDVLASADMGSWGKGYCPLCGGGPSVAVLRKAGQDDAYLKSHGGQRWLSCSRCAAEWRFKRHACPHCGNEKHGTLEYFRLENNERHRADLCRACGRYLTTYDATQADEDPVAEVTALGLLPLDILMQRDGFQPVARTFWNRID
ncbi:formate dehydrogenase accessory protein FdhE [Desulfocurvus sp. DL9XJH121]